MKYIIRVIEERLWYTNDFYATTTTFVLFLDRISEPCRLTDRRRRRRTWLTDWFELFDKMRDVPSLPDSQFLIDMFLVGINKQIRKRDIMQPLRLWRTKDFQICSTRPSSRGDIISIQNPRQFFIDCNPYLEASIMDEKSLPCPWSKIYYVGDYQELNF